MSRDPFSQDSRGGPEPRDRSEDRSSSRQTVAAPRSEPGRNSALEVSRNVQAADVREPQSRGGGDSLRAYYIGYRSYLLTDSQVHSLKEIGKFRVIRVSDLGTYSYEGDRQRGEKDIRRLERESLLQETTLEISQKRTIRVATLTKSGYRLLAKNNQVPNQQEIYHGLVRRREVQHDADLYRLYQEERARIERGGGRPLRVILDYELQRNLNRDLALLGADKDNPERKSAVAKRHQLQVVHGKIPVPDLRLEYETSELELRHVDLELATRNYGPRAMTQKASAGFALYARSEDVSRLRRVLDARAISARILTL
jgi:hypothetical protein